MTTTLVVPGNLAAISNGRLVARRPLPDGTTSWQWEVRNPINSYNVTFYIGDYVNWHDTLMGEKGMLDLDFWVLRYNEAKARKQFAMVKQMLHCFEYWMGPYPFYEDGYKLVEAPYLGMEHQSAVAYGNEYRMGYRGYDRTGTGIGMNFDYIIVHETGHEWFGNNVTAADMADNWVHEGITTYSESLFEECLTNKEKGQEYCRGEWNNILNNKPIIGPYGVNEEGSGDMYDKGAAIMHMVRVLTGDDEKFRQMLRALGREYYHGIVLTVQVESFIAGNCALDLKAFFDQYLRTDSIPELEYYIKNKTLYYRFNNIVPDFTLPVTIRSKKVKMTISPTAAWQEVKWKGGYHLDIEKNFLITIKN
jgi:aminopeptidase N